MRKSCFIAVGLLLLVANACETKNVGGGLDPCRFTFYSLSFSDTRPLAGSDVTATFGFGSCSAPYTFVFTFSDCVSPPVQTVVVPVEGQNHASLTFTLEEFTASQFPNGKNCSVVVTGTDGRGSIAGPVTGTFHVEAITIPPPEIWLTFNAATCAVTATAADPNGEDVEISVTALPPSLQVDAMTKTVVGGSGTVDFFFSPADIIAGGSGVVTFAATNGFGDPGVGTIHVSCGEVHIIPDTLYAIPAVSAVNAGAPVRIIVLTGDPASPFQYMTGVRVVTDSGSGFKYVDDSFNVGMPGGDADDVDGIWADDELALGNGDFLLAPDSFYDPVDAGGGLRGFDFNVTPLGATGNMQVGEGALFNFEATFDTPGTYTLGFQHFETVNRTYYQDNNQASDYFWSEITNVHLGVPNSITVI
jgi:hypothetical protein